MQHIYEELAECSRRQILAELKTGHKSVAELVLATGLKQPNVSNHLAKLRSRRIVRATRIGRNVYYALADADVEHVVREALRERTASELNLCFIEHSRKFAEAAVEGDEVECSRILDLFCRAGAPVIDLYEKLFCAAMGHVGDWYGEGRIDEAGEHIATGVTERMLTRLLLRACPAKPCGASAVLGCAEGNHHALGLRMASDYLKQQGWQTLFLGPNVPARSFASCVSRIRPTLTLVSVCHDASIPATCEVLASLRNVGTGEVIVGGRAAKASEDILRRAGADRVVASLRELGQIVEGECPDAFASAL